LINILDSDAVEVMDMEAGDLSGDGKIFLLAQTASNFDRAGFGEQMRSILTGIDTFLEGAGRNRSHLILANIDLRDINDFSELNVIWDNWMGSAATPRRFIRESKDLPHHCFVRIDVAAAWAI
jgi:enamine deaminase RidA (YjgF/YER057c/UK114 family)